MLKRKVEEAKRKKDSTPELAVPTPNNLSISNRPTREFLLNSETVEPETVEPETVEPETVEPETVEPETVEPETVKQRFVKPEDLINPENVVDPENIKKAVVVNGKIKLPGMIHGKWDKPKTKVQKHRGKKLGMPPVRTPKGKPQKGAWFRCVAIGCEKPIWVKQCDIPKNKDRFCSSECRKEYTSTHITRAERERRRKQYSRDYGKKRYKEEKERQRENSR